jgi:hypothetical protein
MLQAYEGYIEKGNVFPVGLLSNIIERQRVIITVLDEPVQSLKPVKGTADSCPLLGMYSDGKLTVDNFLAWKREEKELEQ